LGLTPDQERKRQREIKLLANDWEAYPPTSELKRRTKKGFWWLIDKIWKRKYQVKILYLWSAELFANLNMMSYPVPLDHDNLKKPENMPYIFALKNGWTIPESDLKTLTHGPLLSEKGVILVKEGGKFSFYWNKIWPTVVVFVTLIGLIRSIAWLFSFG